MIKLTVTLALLGGLTLGMADTISVDAQIAAIQAAPAQERVKLMNEFKQALATMNADERNVAISKIRARTQTQEHVQMMQMNENQHLSQVQKMNQQQAITQAVSPIGGSMPINTNPSSVTPSPITTPKF